MRIARPWRVAALVTGCASALWMPLQAVAANPSMTTDIVVAVGGAGDPQHLSGVAVGPAFPGATVSFTLDSTVDPLVPCTEFLAGTWELVDTTGSRLFGPASGFRIANQVKLGPGPGCGVLPFPIRTVNLALIVAGGTGAHDGASGHGTVDGVLEQGVLAGLMTVSLDP